MKRAIILATMLLSGIVALAQSAQSTQNISSAPSTSSVPATATNTDADSAKARREARKEAFAAEVSRIVESRNYIFRPITMQNVVTGNTRDIFAYYLFAAIAENKIVLHLPVEFTSYVIDTINLDAYIEDYVATLSDGNWRITFSFMNGAERWFAEFFLSTITGQTRLALVTPKGVMRYLGTLESGIQVKKKRRKDIS